MNSADIAKQSKWKEKLLKTVSGGTLTAWMKGKKYILQMKMEVCQKLQLLM
jgi:hypothetical protein